MAASLASGAAERDARLRSAEFFDVARYPEIVFRSTAVERRGDGWVAHGELTMHGVTKPVELAFAIAAAATEAQAPSLGIQASTAIDRDAFGITAKRDRPPFAGSRVAIEIRLLTRPAESEDAEPAGPAP